MTASEVIAAASAPSLRSVALQASWRLALAIRCFALPSTQSSSTLERVTWAVRPGMQRHRSCCAVSCGRIRSCCPSVNGILFTMRRVKPLFSQMQSKATASLPAGPHQALPVCRVSEQPSCAVVEVTGRQSAKVTSSCGRRRVFGAMRLRPSTRPSAMPYCGWQSWTRPWRSLPVLDDG